jgi:hypothetical protein
MNRLAAQTRLSGCPEILHFLIHPFLREIAIASAVSLQNQSKTLHQCHIEMLDLV